MNLVLCYHHVSPTRTLYSTPPQVFSDHLEVLKAAGYSFVSHDEFAVIARGGFASKAKTVLVTFDDGHADNWFHARPILEAASVPAVMFTISAAVASGAARLPDEEPRIAATPEAEDMLMPLRWAELKAWQACGLLSIQTHTHRHREMRGFKGGSAELERLIGADLDLACATLKERTGHAPSSIAWPWGYGNQAMQRAASARGLDLQFSVTPGFNGSWAPLRRLHRICLDGASADEVRGWATRFPSRSLAAAYSTARRLYNSMRQQIASPPPTQLSGMRP